MQGKAAPAPVNAGRPLHLYQLLVLRLSSTCNAIGGAPARMDVSSTSEAINEGSNTKKNRRQQKWIGHVLRHDGRLRTVTDGRLIGKKRQGEEVAFSPWTEIWAF